MKPSGRKSATGSRAELNVTADNIEIERKYMVQNLPDLSHAARTEGKQGYLTGAGDSVAIRLRQADDRFFLTLKTDGGMARVEREACATAGQFETFWPQTEGRRVEKTRCFGADVTEDKSFNNKALARDGVPERV